ncbi:uncharacterized protein BDV17DRAFT_261714 [Aspergillus undulatus]|uniref:uncharacterized protein n=1 Tax=Aspergillus undulatus TaxID=1810928 RepID=UPI003CCDAEC3
MNALTRVCAVLYSHCLGGGSVGRWAGLPQQVTVPPMPLLGLVAVIGLSGLASYFGFPTLQVEHGGRLKCLVT